MLLRASNATVAKVTFSALALVVAATAPASAGDLHAVTAAPAKAEPGAPAKASIKLAAKNGWHLNEDAPITVKLNPGSGVALEKEKLGRKDMAKGTQDEAQFDVGFTAAEPGPKTIEAEARFVICQDTACKQVTGKTTVKVDVAAANKPGKAKKSPKKKG